MYMVIENKNNLFIRMYINKCLESSAILIFFTKIHTNTFFNFVKNACQILF